MYRVKVGLAQLGLSGAKMKTACPSQITKYAFSTTEKSKRAEPLKEIVNLLLGFVYNLFLPKTAEGKGLVVL